MTQLWWSSHITRPQFQSNGGVECDCHVVKKGNLGPRLEHAIGLTCLPGTCMGVKCLQLCPTLCDPMDCSLPGSSVHEILQARILEWVAGPSSRGSS